MRTMWLLVVVGIVLVLIGLLWTLQGLNVLGGSVMSGSPVWGTIGPIVLIVGVVLIIVALVRRRRRSGA
ncbi:vacuolar-type H+-ATPase subunit I/STV1 [Leifsonia shinshuensis]|nr:vacuolar-type H+-ATPase subunit I/STV1 [Leifsonia shinshuensis]